jgi:chemotaxis protein MotB
VDELEEARARIAELEGRVSALTAERDAASARMYELEEGRSAFEAQLTEAVEGRDTATASLTEARAAGLAHLRRALLAEQAGQVVPELVTGEDEATLLASVEVARSAFSRATEAARAELAAQTVPIGAPSARGMETAALDGLSPFEKIATGLAAK